MPKKNVYVSEELDELINSHEGPIPFSQLVTKAIEDYLGAKACPTCGQTVKLTKVKGAVKQKSLKRGIASDVVENPHTIEQMKEMPWAELKAYAREIDDGSIDMNTRKRLVLIQSIVASTGQSE